MKFGRAGLIVDLTYLATLLAPLASWFSFRLARRRRWQQHRAAQLSLLAICWATVLAFEVNLRLQGGSGAFLSTAAAAWRPLARSLLLVHISAAVSTYTLWSWLAWVSQGRFQTRLPGNFSRRHRRTGKLVFAGLVFTAFSATGMYVLTFVWS